MLKKITSDRLSAWIDTHGAELRRVTARDGTEFLWSGDPTVWEGVSPVLFPICGSLREHCYRHKGKRYPMTPHGFAQRMEFAVERETERELTLLLNATEETKREYPFDFALRVTFALMENRLSVTYCVTNSGTAPLYFSLGAHEGYATPGGIEAYDLVFDEPGTLTTCEVDGNGLLTDRTATVLADSAVLPLKECLFDWDSLVFDRIACRKCTLIQRNGSRKIRLTFDDFRNFLVWHEKGAEFLCLEPWTGLPDRFDANGILREKESVTALAPQRSHCVSHTITFYQ